MADNEQKFIRQILNEGFHRLDSALFEVTMQIDKLADRDMIRFDRVEQVKLRQDELLEMLEELDIRIKTLENWSQKSHIIIRHSVSVIVCVVIIITYLYYSSAL